MKIIFFGDSITDSDRNRNELNNVNAYGNGYVRILADRLIGSTPERFEIHNQGCGGNRVVDLYARIKRDVWNYEPDIVSILVGINDVWHEMDLKNGVDLERFETIYRMMIAETLKVLPNVKIILCEPFVLEGTQTKKNEGDPKRFERFCDIYNYAKVVENLAKEFNIFFLPLQDAFSIAAKNSKTEYYLMDGVHPNTAGANLIANEWMKLFKEKLDN